MRNYKLPFLTACMMLLPMHAIFAQNLKFGKPSPEELALTVCDEAPDAPAVVLCRTMDMTYDFAGSFEAYDNTMQMNTENLAHSGKNSYVNPSGTSMLYHVKQRIKILKADGAGYANMDIVYYSKEGDLDLRDEFYEFNVVVFNQVNGKLKKQRLDKQSWTDERLDANYMVRKLRVPGVQAGSIVEVQYELFSKRISFIYDWQMQEEIPVRYAKCDLAIPLHIKFIVNAAIRSNVKSTCTEGQILMKQQISDLQAPKKVRTSCYHIESHDMLPWSIDPIKQTPGTDKAMVLTKVENTTMRGIKMPEPMPQGTQWITINP